MYTEITRAEIWNSSGELFAVVEGGSLVTCGEDMNASGEAIDAMRCGLEELFRNLHSDTFDVRFPELGE